jgi:hypothetical protein
VGSLNVAAGKKRGQPRKATVAVLHYVKAELSKGARPNAILRDLFDKYRIRDTVGKKLIADARREIADEKTRRANKAEADAQYRKVLGRLALMRMFSGPVRR